MRDQYGGSVAPAVGVAAVLVLALSLVGCTAPQPAPRETTASPTPSATASEAPVPVAEPTAVVTIATIDVDGLNVTLAGMVTLVDEDGGTCIFVATSTDGSTVERESEGSANVNSTSCGSVQVPADEFARGSWEVVMRYASEQLELTSDPLQMEIP